MIPLFQFKAALRFLKYIFIAVLACLVVLSSCVGCISKPSVVAEDIINVVAAENFWGNIAAQLGGIHIQVTSLVNSPSADPHEYETTTADARTIVQANYVILNGAGYDSWGQKLLDANPVSGRKVLDVATFLGKKQGDNPHFWYNPDYIDRVADQITRDYQELNPYYAEYYAQQHTSFEDAMAQYYQLITAIKQDYSGTKIGATESIFAYMADALGLDLITPPAFLNATAASTDPPVPAVVLFQQQIDEKQIAVLIYNSQTTTSITTNIRQLAESADIPVMGVTETIVPPDASFQSWQVKQLQELQNALSSQY